MGVFPFVGELGDGAKLVDKAVDTAKVLDKASDAAKAGKAADAAEAADKAAEFSSFPKTIHMGKQGKHMVGHNNYIKGKSILDISSDTAQDLINSYSGTGQKIGINRERVNFKKVIGKYVDPKTGKEYDTTVGTIHYSKSGTHIVPERPINWRE